MTEQELLEEININIPDWITWDEFEIEDIKSIQYGGCASGAYMPAVTYHDASKTMGEYGDDVLDFIEQQYGELPPIPEGSSWSGIAVHYLSCAVELWAAQFDCEDIDDD